MNFETGVKLSDYRAPGLLLAIPLGVLLRAYILLCRFTSRIRVEGENPPPRSILFFIHRDYYLSITVTPPFLEAVGKLVWLGYHGFYSYVPWRWFIGPDVLVCRYPLKSAQKPFSYILEFMKRHPDRTYVQYTDSGGPYGRVRESLVRLAQEMDRPVVACRVFTTSYVPILQHHFPLPFGRIQLSFASPVPASTLKSLPVAEGREIIQNTLDALRIK